MATWYILGSHRPACLLWLVGDQARQGVVSTLPGRLDCGPSRRGAQGKKTLEDRDLGGDIKRYNRYVNPFSSCRSHDELAYAGHCRH